MADKNGLNETVDSELKKKEMSPIYQKIWEKEQAKILGLIPDDAKEIKDIEIFYEDIKKLYK